MNIFLVMAAGFFLTAAGMLYAPVMPMHAKALGAPVWVITSVPMGLPSIVSLIILLPIAVLADNTGKRKEILLVVSVLTLIANAGLALAKSWVALTIWRLISGIPFAFLSMFAVILAFILPEEKRGMAMGLGMGSAMLGMGVFQALSGYLVNIFGSYTGLYYLGAILAGLTFLLLLPVKAPVVKTPAAISGKDLGEVLSNRNILLTGVALCIYLIGWQMMYGSFPIVLTDVISVPVQLQTVFFAVASVMLGFGTFIWGPVIDSMGAKRVLLLGITMSAVATFILIPLAARMWPYVILFWIATLGGVAGAPGASTIATRSVKMEMATLALNTMFLFVTLAGIIGGFLAGPILASAGLSIMLVVAAVLQLAGDMLLLKVPNN